MVALGLKIAINVKSAQDFLVIQVCNKMIFFGCCCLLVHGKGSVLVTLLIGAFILCDLLPLPCSSVIRLSL